MVPMMRTSSSPCIDTAAWYSLVAQQKPRAGKIWRTCLGIDSANDGYLRHLSMPWTPWGMEGTGVSVVFSIFALNIVAKGNG